MMPGALPAGLQIVGMPFSEAEVLTVAALLPI
jgi:Asp-tRNA(Asn)/Glu-tRNA(Gln) amidotransferase A subunit family amidase